MLLNLIDQVKRGVLEHSLYSRRSVGLLWGENCAPSSWHKASGSRHRVLLRQADLTHESLKAGIGAKRIEIGVVLAKMSICNRQTVMRRCRHRGKPEGQRTASSRTHLSPYRWYVRRKGTAGRRTRARAELRRMLQFVHSPFIQEEKRSRRRQADKRGRVKASHLTWRPFQDPTRLLGDSRRR